MFKKSLVLGAVLAAGLVSVAQAQPQYAGAYPYYQPAPTPPSWSYDPYTSGLGPCPQRKSGDQQCRYTVFPSYGQPSYWPN